MQTLESRTHWLTRALTVLLDSVGHELPKLFRPLSWQLVHTPGNLEGDLALRDGGHVDIETFSQMLHPYRTSDICIPLDEPISDSFGDPPPYDQKRRYELTLPGSYRPLVPALQVVAYFLGDQVSGIKGIVQFPGWRRVAVAKKYFATSVLPLVRQVGEGGVCQNYLDRDRQAQSWVKDKIWYQGECFTYGQQAGKVIVTAALEGNRKP